MNLFFNSKLKDGSDSGFIQKIWSGLICFNIAEFSEKWCNPSIDKAEDGSYSYDPRFELYESEDLLCFDSADSIFPKIHTIRKDKSNRWKVGSKIHFKMWTGRPYKSNMFDFTPVLEVKSIQNISIYNHGEEQKVFIDDKEFYHEYGCYSVGVERMEDLALCDGFDSIDDFFKYFNEDFKGKLIHWTDVSY